MRLTNAEPIRPGTSLQSPCLTPFRPVPPRPICPHSYTYHSDAYAYSLVKPTCLDNYVHTHEYGHNFGCGHDRDNSNKDTDYSHGHRYCDGGNP